MIRFAILKLSIFVLIIVLHPLSEGQAVPVVPLSPFAPRPLCNFQMALANQACAYLPFIQVPPPSPRAPLAPPPPPHDDDDDDYRDDDDDDDDDDDEDKDDHHHDHDHGHGHDHDNEEPDPDVHDHDHDHDDKDHDDHDDHDHDDKDHDDDDHDHDHIKKKHKKKYHRRRRHHRHHHRHKDTPVEQQCCKWLSQVDDQCVCELLVHLPPFLARPVHKYSVIVGNACNITYSCGSRIRN